jgi:hypothetical protein
MAIQKNSAISQTVVRATGFEWHLMNDCVLDLPDDVRDFQRPGMLTLRLAGIRIGNEHRIGYVSDLEDPTNTPSV